MKKILLGISLLTGLGLTVNAQDPHFSQYFSSPLTLNPALTGLTECDFRVAGNYRNQYNNVGNGAGYMTGTVSFDVASLKRKWDNGDALGLGVLLLYDKAGSGSLQNTTVGLSLAYHKALGYEKNHTISLGAQGYLVQKSIEFGKLTFEDMANRMTGTWDLPTMESYPNTDLNYPDFNAGLMYTGRVSDFATIYAGVSFYHISRPTESFGMGLNDYQLHTRTTATIGGSFDLNENVVLYASGLYQYQGKAQEAVAGAAAGFILNPGFDREFSRPTILYLGAWYRFTDAFIPYVSLESKKFKFGVSYDFTASNFSKANKGMGAMEFSLIYNGCFARRDPGQKYNLACPKF